MPRLRLSVALRLALWYAGAAAFSLALAIGISYSAGVRVLRADVDDELRQDLAETAALVQAGGEAAFAQELAVELAGPDADKVFLRLWSPGGEALTGAGFQPPSAADRAALAGLAPGETAPLRTLRLPGREYGVRVGAVRLACGHAVEFGQSLEEEEDLLAALRGGFAYALPAVFLLGVPIGWFMARRALRGVETMRRTALAIADGALDRRVPVGEREDELARLARAFNAMLDRIQALVTGMREVTDNLAHDLRTPLTRLRAAAERTASPSAGREEWSALAGTTTEECDRLLAILNSSLEIAEAEAGAAPLALEELDLTALVSEAQELFQTVAEDAGIALAVEAPLRCSLRADRSRVQRIVANLVDNAIKYTPAGGRVTVSLAERDGEVQLAVRDTGRGIAAAELPRVFERFYRGDPSRSGRGSGLGLSLARAFARAHGGDLTAVSAPGQGSTFTLHLRRSAR